MLPSLAVPFLQQGSMEYLVLTGKCFLCVCFGVLNLCVTQVCGGSSGQSSGTRNCCYLVRPLPPAVLLLNPIAMRLLLPLVVDPKYKKEGVHGELLYYDISAFILLNTSPVAFHVA